MHTHVRRRHRSVARRYRIGNLTTTLKAKVAERRKALELANRLEQEIHTLEVARRLIGGDHLKLTPANSIIVDSASRGYALGNSDLGRAIVTLRAARRPMHVDEIIAAIKIDTGKSPNKSSLVGALARVARQRKHVYRASPNTFGLLTWRHNAGRAAK